MKSTPLVFDYQSSTPCSRTVLDAMAPYWIDVWGNPSNRQNSLGLHSSAAISVARDQLASLLKVSSQRLIFTSGATEANNLALLGYARARAIEKGFPGHLITLSTEHPSVLEPIRQLKKEGFRVTELQPREDGIIQIDQLIDAFQKDTMLVSIMAANNEIGVLQPIAKIAELCHERAVKFHTDLVQAFGNIPINFNQNGIDFYTISGHKIYGPKGIGLLVARDDLNIQPIQWGGGQENGIRAGTLPVPLIIGLTKSVEVSLSKLDYHSKRMRILLEQLWHGLNNELSDLILNGSFDQRLPNNLNFTVKGVNGTLLHKKLRPYLACSSGSACSNGSLSHVLLSLGRTAQEAESSLRLSLGRSTTSTDVASVIAVISKVVNHLRR